MTFTIDELEALKEGTTPGLWAATNPPYSPHNPPEIFDAETASLILRIDPETDHPGYADRNLQLLAASPAVIDQLIAAEAKLQQLKAQIENLADWHDVKASKARVYPRPQEKERFIGKAEAHETARNKLTRILEGNHG